MTSEADLLNSSFANLLASQRAGVVSLADEIQTGRGSELTDELIRLATAPNACRPPWRRALQEADRASRAGIKSFTTNLARDHSDPLRLRLCLGTPNSSHEYDASGVVKHILRELSAGVWARKQLKGLFSKETRVHGRDDLGKLVEDWMRTCLAWRKFTSHQRRSNEFVSEEAALTTVLGSILLDLDDAFLCLDKLRHHGFAKFDPRDPTIIDWKAALEAATSKDSVVRMIWSYVERARRSALHDLTPSQSTTNGDRSDFADTIAMLPSLDDLEDPEPSQIATAIMASRSTRRALMLEIHCLKKYEARKHRIKQQIRAFASPKARTLCSEDEQFYAAMRGLAQIERQIIGRQVEIGRHEYISEIGVLPKGALVSDEFYVRRTQHEAVERALEDDHRLIFIGGPQQSGKTTLAHKATATRDHLLIDFQGRGKTPGSAAELIPGFIRRATQGLPSTGIIVIDEIDAFASGEEWKNAASVAITALVRQGHPVIVISNLIAHKDVQPALASAGCGQHSCQSIRMTDFQESEILALIELYERGGSKAFETLEPKEQLASTIHDFFGGHPQLVHGAVYEIANGRHARASLSVRPGSILSNIGNRFGAIKNPPLIDAMKVIATDGPGAVLDHRIRVLHHHGLVRTDGEIRTPLYFDLLEKQGILTHFDGRYRLLTADQLTLALLGHGRGEDVDPAMRTRLMQMGFIRIDGTVRFDLVTLARAAALSQS